MIGRVVSTVKLEPLAGHALQWVQPLRADGTSAGKPLVAVDRAGVGPGEAIVYVTSREAAIALPDPFAAIDAAIVAKVDWCDVGETRTLRER